jgi:CDP-diacylglycerol pyrophosphatase
VLWRLLAVIVLVGACAAARAGDGAPSDDPSALRTIVLDCLDSHVPDYCTRCPEPLEGTCGVSSCWNGTDVWAETDRFVAIRDRKMCHCPAGFVHGLALPRALVTGVEDPHRPDGIWPFAWQVAVTRIPVAAEIGLAVNPPFARTQDQLHVHIVRLRGDARARIERLSPVRIAQLDGTWQAATEHARRRGYASYGVAVVQAAGGGYLVVSTDVSPEYAFTQSTCTGSGFTSSR